MLVMHGRVLDFSGVGSALPDVALERLRLGTSANLAGTELMLCRVLRRLSGALAGSRVACRCSDDVRVPQSAGGSVVGEPAVEFDDPLGSVR